MQQPQSIRQGAIHILPDCPPLHGGELKHRPVVVVAVVPDKPGVLIVAVSTKATHSVHDRIRLPDRSAQPQATSGLTEACWVVPEWYMIVEAHKLGRKLGYISGARLQQIAKAVQVHIAAGKKPVERRELP